MANYINKVIVNGETKIDLTADTVTAADILTGKTAHDKSGAPITGTCNYDTNTTDATATAAEILSGKTAYVNKQKVTGTMPNNESANLEITTLTDVTIPAGYHDGGGKARVSATEKAKIIADNIRQGITILGVEGAMSGTEDVQAQSKTVTPSFEQQEITPDTGSGYNYLASVTVNAIPVQETFGTAAGYTLTIG